MATVPNRRHGQLWSDALDQWSDNYAGFGSTCVEMKDFHEDQLVSSNPDNRTIDHLELLCRYHLACYAIGRIAYKLRCPPVCSTEPAGDHAHRGRQGDKVHYAV